MAGELDHECRPLLVISPGQHMRFYVFWRTCVSTWTPHPLGASPSPDHTTACCLFYTGPEALEAQSLHPDNAEGWGQMMKGVVAGAQGYRGARGRGAAGGAGTRRRPRVLQQRSATSSGALSSARRFVFLC